MTAPAIKPATALHFGTVRGYIVNANPNGSIPLAAKIYARLDSDRSEDGGENQAAPLLMQANAYPQLIEDRRRLVEFVKAMVRQAPAHADRAPRDQYAAVEGRALLRELGEAS